MVSVRTIRPLLFQTAIDRIPLVFVLFPSSGNSLKHASRRTETNDAPITKCGSGFPVADSHDKAARCRLPRFGFRLGLLAFGDGTVLAARPAQLDDGVRSSYRAKSQPARAQAVVSARRAAVQVATSAQAGNKILAVHTVAELNKDFLDDTIDRSVKRRLHLHRFERHQFLALLDLGADAD